MRAPLTPEEHLPARSHNGHSIHAARPARGTPVSTTVGASVAAAAAPAAVPPTTTLPPTSPPHGVTPGPPPAMQEGNEPSPLTALVARARDGVPEAVEELMREVRLRAMRYARARLGSFPFAAHAAEDAAQEACLAVLTSLPTYDERGVPFESFVYSICARKVADVQRSVYRGPDPTADIPDGMDPDADPALVALRKDEAGSAWALLDQLSEQQREVLTLRVAVGLSATETAAALYMTPGSVRVSQHRALNRLRELLARREDPE